MDPWIPCSDMDSDLDLPWICVGRYLSTMRSALEGIPCQFEGFALVAYDWWMGGVAW